MRPYLTKGVTMKKIALVLFLCVTVAQIVRKWGYSKKNYKIERGSFQFPSHSLHTFTVTLHCCR